MPVMSCIIDLVALLERVAATDDAWIRDYFHRPRGCAATQLQEQA